MEHCAVRGFLIILLIQHCTLEGLSTSIHSSTEFNPQDGENKPQEPALPPAEVVPVVSPPSLEEVQQAVLEASEQVEGRGAEEVLKELLERVVEAALGQVEAGGEGAVDLEQGEISESDNEADVDWLQHTVINEKIKNQEEDTDVEEHEVEENDAFENVGEEEKEVIKERDEIESAGKITPSVEPGVQNVDGVDVRASQGVEEAALEEIGKGLAVEDTEEDNTEQEKVIAETETLVKIVSGRQSEQEQEPIPGQDNVEVIRHESRTQVDEVKGELIALPLDHLFLEDGQIEAEVAMEQEDLEYQQGLLVEQQAVKDEEAEVSDTSESIGGKKNAEREESVAMENVEDDQRQRVGEEEIALDTSGTEKQDQVLVISGPESEDQTPMEQSPENQNPSENPSFGEVDTGENTHDDTKQNQVNEIITPTGNLLPHFTAEAKPALDNSVNEQPAHPQGEEPGKVNELVEDTCHTSEAKELGLEAWKIGAISAAALAALETVFIIIYILKCRNKSSSSAIQRTCEDGCVEPEPATGGDCSDDNMPAGNGDTQQIMLLDSSKVASMRAKTKEQKVEHAIAMPHLPPSTTEGLAKTGPEQDTSQHENL